MIKNINISKNFKQNVLVSTYNKMKWQINIDCKITYQLDDKQGI